MNATTFPCSHPSGQLPLTQAVLFEEIHATQDDGFTLPVVRGATTAYEAGVWRRAARDLEERGLIVTRLTDAGEIIAYIKRHQPVTF